MKCPNCGGETGSDICEYCGSKISNLTQNNIEYIGKCPQCGSPKIKFQRESLGVKGSRNSIKIAKGVRVGGSNYNTEHRTIGICQNCGFTWQPNHENKKRHGILWWILAVMFWPISLSIWIIKTPKVKLDIKWRIVIVVVLWIVLFAFSAISNNSVVDTQNSDILPEQTTNTTESTEPSLESFTNELSNKINNKLSLNYCEDFKPSDKDNQHYREEFRLTEFKEAIGKSYTFDNASLDLVTNQTTFGVYNVRIYVDNATLEQCIQVINECSSIIDNSITAEEISEAVDYIKDNKTANGYYYGKLGLLLLGNDKSGYELMIKYE